jgi:rod shape-determining protein MreD
MMVVLLASAVAQVLIPAPEWVAQVKLPLLLGAVLYYGLVYGAEHMAVAALVGGLLQDALGSTPLAYSCIGFGVTGLAAVRLRRLVLAEALVTQALFGLAAGLLSSALMGLLLRLEGRLALPLAALLVKVQCGGVLGMVAAPVVFAFAGRLDRLVGNLGPAEGEVRLDERRNAV